MSPSTSFRTGLLSRLLASRWGRRGLVWLGLQVRIDDSPGWTSLTLAGGGPADRPWSELQQEFVDVLEAWRRSAWVRQVVRLTTAYVVGDGVTVSSTVPDVQAFLSAFWVHPENLMDQRLAPWCDELTRAGELFPVLFTNKYSGMSQVRAVPASCIEQVVTDPQDYEKEVGYQEIQPGQIERKSWRSWRTARLRPPAVDGRRYAPEPVMLHYAVNKVVGATRGESDLGPLLPWAQRYAEWLRERVRFNKLRNDLAAVQVKVKDDSLVDAKQKQYSSNPPKGGAVVVTGPGEELAFPNANIQGIDASPDGKAMRLAMAAASNLSLVHFGEGDTANLSTSVSMDDRTFRTHSQRRDDFAFILSDLCSQAYRRYRAALGSAVVEGEELGIGVKFPDISRSDNKELAGAAREAVTALKDLGESLGMANNQEWRVFALRMALKFAGEILPEDEIKKILGPAGAGQPGEKSPNGKEKDGTDDKSGK